MAGSAVVARAKQLIHDVRASGDPSAKAWDAAFRKGKFSSEVLAEAVQQLHSEKQYEDVVECLLSSLRNDHAQPWTYDVLAIEMKLANRPTAELDRVLQSRVDFSAGNIPQMLITAAMLSRFDAHAEALRICREAAELTPEAAEPWMMARGISDRLNSPKDRVWARCGVLQHVWTEQFQKEHDEARKVIPEILDQLEKAGETAMASELREQFRDASITDLRIIVRWAGTADLDLLVDEPSGTQCSYKNQLTSAGGRLIRQDSGNAQQSGNRMEEYVCVRAMNGEYNVVIRFVLGKVVAGNAVVEIVQGQNTPDETRVRKTVPLANQDVNVPVTVTKGRVKKAAEKSDQI